MPDISLDGGEIAVIKALGTGGSEFDGEQLMERCPDLLEAELASTLHGLVSMGFVIADRSSFSSGQDLKKTRFHVNSGYARELKEAMNPTQEKPKSRRVRRE